MWERQVLKPILPTELSRRRAKKILKSFLFFKEKFQVNGTLARLKARLVANGNMQGETLHADKTSPAARIESVLMCLAIAAAEGRTLVAIDIGNAFLEAKMTGEEVLIELDEFCVRLLLKIAPHLKPYVDERGKMVSTRPSTAAFNRPSAGSNA